MVLDTLVGVVWDQPLVSLVVFLSVVYFINSWSAPRVNIPPTPVRPWPFLGHIPMMRNNPREAMKQWRAQSGEVFSIYMGDRLTIILNGFDVIKEALVKQADIFSDRPPPQYFQHLTWMRKGLVTASGELWKEQRTVSLSILRSFGMGKNSLAEKIEEEVDCYMEALSRLADKPSDVRTLTTNCVSNVICNIILGKRFELDDEEFISLLTILNEQFILAGQVGMLSTIPLIAHLPGDLTKEKKLLSNYYKVRDFFQERFIGPMKNKTQDNESDCFITDYLNEMQRRNDSGKPTTMDEVNLSRVIVQLFGAGSETTSTTILWFVLLMLHHPESLSKIYSEIIENVGPEKKPTMSDKPVMNYLNASIMETQRFASIVPFSLQHYCNKTTTLNGYTIPEGATIIPNLDTVLLDEAIWGDPMAFRPERFLGENGKPKSMEEFVVFSLGKRICLGESLAKMELFLFISRLCQRFHMIPAEDGKLPPLEGVFGITSAPKAYRVKFIERNCK